MAVFYATRQLKAINNLLAGVPNDLRMICEWACHTLWPFRQLGATMAQQRGEEPEARQYVAYLLRLWRETAVGPTHWRASLQDPESSERVGFATLEQLFSYLRKKTADPPEGCRHTLRNKETGS
jgi:hypothetical protein